MSDDGGGKKSFGGHIALGLAGLGALFARTADDCGRVALKGGAAVSDDAFRGASRVGSLADDGMRGSKLGSLADDGMRAGKYGPLADDGMRNGMRVPPHGEPHGGGLVEEAATGAKAESHAGDAAEFGVDVSLEVISNAGPSEDDDGPAHSTDAFVGAGNAPKFDTITLLKNRTRVSQPALVPVMPKSTKAFKAILGRTDKLDEGRAYVSLRPIPDNGETVMDPLRWLKGRLAHNPIAMVFYTTDATGKKNPIPLVLPNGGTTDDSIVHQACIGHLAHCIVLVCKPDGARAKEPCAKAVVDGWQSITTSRSDMSLDDLLEKLVQKRAATPALQGVTISRVDVSQDAARIVRSRLTPKGP